METSTSAAAERNKQAICDELLRLLPARGSALEIASGTGQHVVQFAAAIPGIIWQPTDFQPADLGHISARRNAANLTNIAAPVLLDVLAESWPVAGEFDAIVCINMIHISPWETTPALFAGAVRHLRRDGGMVVLYGPYREQGRHTAPSNEEFEQWLKLKDQRFGVRNLEEVEAVAAAAGFQRTRLVRMPANNLLLAFQRLR